MRNYLQEHDMGLHHDEPHFLCDACDKGLMPMAHMIHQIMEDTRMMRVHLENIELNTRSK